MDPAQDLIGKLSLAEKCLMVAGADLWLIPGCERLGIPDWRVSDGPVGVRGRAATRGLTLPGPTAMAATWDIDLVEQMGVALGLECTDRDVDLLLAPTVNLQRSPRGGRHFEMFSEDPELSARMAVAYITGVESQGVGACVKHLVANDQEHERFTIDAHIDERTMREVHLRPFEAAVTEAGVRSVMGAYNFVNGHHACANGEILLDVLKGEWGFDGVVISDWGAIKDTVAPAQNGLDVEMPGPGRWWGDHQLEDAVEAGEVDEADLDDKVRRILAFLRWRNRLPGTAAADGERSVERSEHRALARRAAADSMVLLRNDGILPLAQGQHLALIGPGAAATALLGGGSATLTPYRSTSILDAMAARWSGTLVHVEGVNLDRKAPSVPEAWIGDDGVKAELFTGAGFDGDLIRVEQASGVARWWYGDTFPDGIDRLSVRLIFTMTPDEDGQYYVVGSGFGGARLYIDGVLATDTALDHFPAGIGLEGAGATLDLIAGRAYDMVLEQVPSGDETQKASLTDVGIRRLPDPAASFAEAEHAAAEADVVVLVVGTNDTWEHEGSDRDDLELPRGQAELVRRVAAANPRTIVLINSGAPTLLPWLDSVPASLLIWYPGQEGSDAVVDVLLGEAEPGGRMPTTWPRQEQDTPSYGLYPGHDGIVEYGEALHVGHRWYEREGITPLLPFGSGGSYTTFEWEDPTVTGTGADAEVQVTVRNTGDRTGSDVVQVYVAPVDAGDRPIKVLGGFAKVEVDAGEAVVARVRISPRSFQRWDVGAHDWILESGDYELVVAASTDDVRFRIPHEIDNVVISTT